MRTIARWAITNYFLRPITDSPLMKKPQCWTWTGFPQHSSVVSPADSWIHPLWYKIRIRPGAILIRWRQIDAIFS